MAVSSHSLAEALASRIDSILPEGLACTALAGEVRIVRDGEVIGGSAAPKIIDADRERDVRQVETAARATLSAIQDVVAEYLTLPWPVVPDGTMPLPDARVTDGWLELWFGERDSPAAALPSIYIDDL